MPPKDEIAPLTAEHREEIAKWRGDNVGKAPDAVINALDQHGKLVDALHSSSYRLGRLLTLLRLAMGITPSSEKMSSGKALGGTQDRNAKKPRDEAERLRLNLERHNRLSAWHRMLANGHKRKAKNTEDALKTLEEIEPTPEEAAAIAKAHEEYLARLQLGGGKDPVLEPSREPFMRGGNLVIAEEYVDVPVEPEVLAGLDVKEILVDERTRYDFSLNLSRITLGVEKAIVRDGEGGTKMISASTDQFGPHGSAVTWSFLANLMILVSQYALPFNRLGTMLSSPVKKFGPDSLSAWFIYVAERFVPIYLYLVKLAANAAVLAGDDTYAHVVEILRYLKALKAQVAGEDLLVPPWAHYTTIDIAKETLKKEGPHDLGTLIGAHLPFVSERLDGKGSKSELHVTVLIGRAEQTDPRSLIVVYRSHFGGFGNMLNATLGYRDRANSELTVQSDLSTVNLVSDPELKKWLTVTPAGCADHARRAFHQHQKDDPDLCAHMLHCFTGLAIYEKGLDLYGRNFENTKAVRGVDGRLIWEEIKEIAAKVAKRWSPETKLGERARYITRHYAALTRYLDDPRLAPGNSMSERMLRPEKLIEDGSHFRWSLTGRFALDVNRTVLQTAIAAHAPLNDYVEHVLKAPPDDVATNPEKYTPLAFAKSLPPPESDAVATKPAAEPENTS